MLSAIGFFLKVTIFAAIVLILGNVVQWRGKTISDQVRTQMSHAERSQIVGNLKDQVSNQVKNVKDWSGDLVNDARSGSTAKERQQNRQMASGARTEGSDQIPLSERQKLRALIRELNGSR